MLTSSYIQHSCKVDIHKIRVPLDPTGASFPGRQIEVAARVVTAPGGENNPYLLFLQGGPGGQGPRVGDFRDGWSGEALKHYRLVLMDQRGTGLSTPLSAEAVTAEDDPALFLKMFLQNQILFDAEALRDSLAGDQKWATLGQSYGGFLTLGYLSQYPDAVSESYITGGLPSLGSIDGIYHHTYPLTAARNRVFFDRYEEDQQVIREVAAHLANHEEHLPTGERLSPTRMRSVGAALGGAMSFDLLHYLWEDPFESQAGELRLTPRFLAQAGARLSQAEAPLYWVLQEAIYGQTTVDQTGEPTNWAAERLSAEYEGFHLDADPLDTSSPWYLTGEHAFRALISEDPATAPLLDTVDQLATDTDWPQTYDEDALAASDVPVAALMYEEDMFVPRVLSQRTADLLPQARTWVTNRMQHDGLRAGGAKVFSGLYDLMRD